MGTDTAVPVSSIPPARCSSQGEHPVPPPVLLTVVPDFVCGVVRATVWIIVLIHMVMKHRTAWRIPSGSTDCTKSYPFSCSLIVRFSACVCPFLPAWHSWVSHTGVTRFSGSYLQSSMHQCVFEGAETSSLRLFNIISSYCSNYIRINLLHCSWV